ncbi:MAG: DUF1203 domain-containing protein [Rhodobacter sp.]|jgi:hypothetical protein|nr:DUF1203 domain-containing protein [Rhodobacter sp.]
MPHQFHAYDQGFVDAIRAGGPDANGLPAERDVSDGAGNPCRSCLRGIPQGEAMLILAARPFETLQPYAETGPIFLCEKPCAPWRGPGIPPILTTSPEYLLKGYSPDHRIVYGTGTIVGVDRLEDYASMVLKDARVAYVDVRSARNNCFLTRMTATT